MLADSKTSYDFVPVDSSKKVTNSDKTRRIKFVQVS